MPVRIFYLEPTENTSNTLYSPPSVTINDEEETVTIERRKKLEDMTRDDMNSEIDWADNVFEPDLRNRGLAEGLIETLLRIIAAGIVQVERRLVANNHASASV